MPYNSSGIYTAPSGATNATPGQVIRSATWDTIFIDLSAALTQVGEQLWSHPVTVTSNYTVATTVAAIIVNATVGVTLTLLPATAAPASKLIIKTVAAQTVVSASSNVSPLTATTAGTAILAGTAGKWAQLQSDGTNWVVMMAN